MYLPMDSAFLNALATSARAIDKIIPFNFTKQARMRGTQTHKEHRTYTKIKTWPGAAFGVRVAAGPWKYWADVIAHFFWLHHQL